MLAQVPSLEKTPAADPSPPHRVLPDNRAGFVILMMTCAAVIIIFLTGL
jgi:hypothetical protein